MPHSCLIVVLAVMLPMSAAAEEYRTRTETVVARMDDSTEIRFQDIARTTFSYTGEDGRDTLSIDWALRIESDDSRDFEEIADQFDVVIDGDGDRITVRLEHPRLMGPRGFFGSLFRNDPDWHVEMNVTGPAEIGLDCDAEFSEISFAGTNGILAIDADFGETTITDHHGALNAEVSFGEFDCTELDGTFSFDADFADVSCDLVRLAGDSRASVSFGSVKLGFPVGTDADINADSSFGGIKYRVDDAHDQPHDGAGHRMLGRGGPDVDLAASFGDIIIRTGEKVEHAISSNDRDSNAVFPIISSAMWQYFQNRDSMTLSVKSIGTLGGWPTAVLSCSDAPDRPFDTIGIVARDDGLYLTSIEGRFFGHRLPPMRFDEPRLWLPYRAQAYVEGDDVVGTVTITDIDGVVNTPSGSLENVITYRIVVHDEETWRIVLAPGVGFAAIGPWDLTGYDLGDDMKQGKSPKEARPQFKEGVVRSITVRGAEVIGETEIRDRLGIVPGSRYTRAEIEEAVDALPLGHRIIEDATFHIEEDGALTVRVHERDLLDVDFEPMLSFNRVGGVGIGPRVTVESLLGPVSLIDGGGEYHFASKEWTYDVRGEKAVGKNRFLTIGGSYRRGYESAMDWAIPDRDSHPNALILGVTTKNLHMVEGATASLTFARESLGSLKVEYFDEKFESVKKHTNWSLFDDDRKDDNPPLPTMSEGRATGMRYAVELMSRTTAVNTGLHLAWEQSWDAGSDSIDDYTRVFGTVISTWMTGPRQMMKLRLAGGWSPDALPPQKDFRLGGFNTLRGFVYETIPLGNPRSFQQGGSRMFLANIEHYLGGHGDFGIILFADAGNVWLDGEDRELGDLRRDIGIGVSTGADFFMFGQAIPSFSAITPHDRGDLRLNWAIPVGPVPHVSQWTVNFVQGF